MRCNSQTSLSLEGQIYPNFINSENFPNIAATSASGRTTLDITFGSRAKKSQNATIVNHSSYDIDRKIAFVYQKSELNVLAHRCQPV